MVRTLPSSAGGMGSIPGQGVKIPHGSGPKKIQNINNRSNITTNSIKTLEMVHIQKKKQGMKYWRDVDNKLDADIS